MKLIKSFFQNVSSRFLAVVTLLWLSVENAFATGGGNGINASKIPDFKIPGVDSNTKDPMESSILLLNHWQPCVQFYLQHGQS